MYVASFVFAVRVSLQEGEKGSASFLNAHGQTKKGKFSDVSKKFDSMISSYP